MSDPTLFHLHFNTPDVDGAADRLEGLDIPLRRRFGSVRGEGVSLGPADEPPEDFRFKLQVHQRGAVNVTLAPGRRPRFDHFGLVSDRVEAVLDRAAARDWSPRPTERRTFVATPWGFRVELHPPSADVVDELGDPADARLEDVLLVLPDAERARETLEAVFGRVPELRVDAGEGPRIDSFDLVTEGGSTPVDVNALLGDGDDA